MATCPAAALLWPPGFPGIYGVWHPGDHRDGAQWGHGHIKHALTLFPDFVAVFVWIIVIMVSWQQLLLLYARLKKNSIPPSGNDCYAIGCSWWLLPHTKKLLLWLLPQMKNAQEKSEDEKKRKKRSCWMNWKTPQLQLSCSYERTLETIVGVSCANKQLNNYMYSFVCLVPVKKIKDDCICMKDMMREWEHEGTKLINLIYLF